ncbi:MAG: hypothetical protein J07HX5_00207 [halophilic archaeon J07HX5]|nr:MAG: hypothetical protein J07HX5_00207 [halophilic archaeon J07HX5]
MFPTGSGGCRNQTAGVVAGYGFTLTAVDNNRIEVISVKKTQSTDDAHIRPG